MVFAHEQQPEEDERSYAPDEPRDANDSPPRYRFSRNQPQGNFRGRPGRFKRTFKQPTRLSFPKKRRLTSREEFQTVYQKGRKVVLPELVLYYYRAPFDPRKRRKGPSRVGICVSRKVGNATERNRVKRIIREAYRVAAPEIRWGFDLVINSRSKCKTMKTQDIGQALKKALGIGNLVYDQNRAGRSFNQRRGNFNRRLQVGRGPGGPGGPGGYNRYNDRPDRPYNRDGYNDRRPSGGYRDGGGYNRDGGGYNRDGGGYNRDGGGYNRDGGGNRNYGNNRYNDQRGGGAPRYNNNREGGYRGNNWNDRGNRQGEGNYSPGYGGNDRRRYTTPPWEENRDRGRDRDFGGGFNRDDRGGNYNRGGYNNRDGNFNRGGGFDRPGFNRGPRDYNENSGYRPRDRDFDRPPKRDED